MRIYEIPRSRAQRVGVFKSNDSSMRGSVVGIWRAVVRSNSREGPRTDSAGKDRSMASIRVALKLLMQSIQLTPWSHRFPRSRGQPYRRRFRCCCVVANSAALGSGFGLVQCHHSPHSGASVTTFYGDDRNLARHRSMDFFRFRRLFNRPAPDEMYWR